MSEIMEMISDSVSAAYDITDIERARETALLNVSRRRVSGAWGSPTEFGNASYADIEGPRSVLQVVVGEKSTMALCLEPMIEMDLVQE